MAYKFKYIEWNIGIAWTTEREWLKSEIMICFSFKRRRRAIYKICNAAFPIFYGSSSAVSALRFIQSTWDFAVGLLRVAEAVAPS